MTAALHLDHDLYSFLASVYFHSFSTWITWLNLLPDAV